MESETPKESELETDAENTGTAMAKPTKTATIRNRVFRSVGRKLVNR